jgi:hypothetical protein
MESLKEIPDDSTVRILLEAEIGEKNGTLNINPGGNPRLVDAKDVTFSHPAPEDDDDE